MRCRLPIPSLIVIICERCRDEAKAFIKTVHLKAAQLKEVAIKLGKAGIAACVLCTAAIGPPAPPASAAAQPPARAEYASYSAMWEFQPAHDFIVELVGRAGGNPMRPMILAADRGDSEPPHFDGPEQTRDGSAATYSGTAATLGVASGLPDVSAWPQSAAGAATTVLPIGPVQRNLMPVIPDPQAIFSSLSLPEHAALQFELPVMEPVRIPKSHHAPTGPRSGRNRDRRAS
jgi:hypothetical protein